MLTPEDRQFIVDQIIASEIRLEKKFNKKIEEEIEALARMVKLGFDEVHELIRNLTKELQRVKQYIGIF